MINSSILQKKRVIVFKNDTFQFEQHPNFSFMISTNFLISFFNEIGLQSVPPCLNISYLKGIKSEKICGIYMSISDILVLQNFSYIM